MIESLRAAFEKIILVGLLSAVIMGMAATSLVKSAHAAPNARENPYPYPKSTYWAWQNRPDLPPNLGLPKDWAVNAAQQGWPVSAYPRKGDIAVFQPGVYGADAKEGHVAVVEQVFDDGTYGSSQMDEEDCHFSASTCGQVNHRPYPLVRGVFFIHYMKDTRTTWGFASGAAGWTAKDLGAGNMGGPGWFYPLAGSDPQLVSPELDVPLDSYNALEVDMTIGVPVADPTMQMFFATEGHPDFSEANSAKIASQSDGALHRYTFYFGSNPRWAGNLTRLRFDPAGGGNTGGVRIDRIRLVQTEAPPSYTTFSEHASGGRSRP